jgi:hypothetical protein
MKDGLDNTPLTYANVMVIKHKYWFEDGRSNTPMIDSTGTHAVEYFIGGKHFTGSCERASIFETTKFYDDEGNPVQFTPGKTFILLPTSAGNPVRRLIAQRGPLRASRREGPFSLARRKDLQVVPPRKLWYDFAQKMRTKKGEKHAPGSENRVELNTFDG